MRQLLAAYAGMTGYFMDMTEPVWSRFTAGIKLETGMIQ